MASPLVIPTGFLPAAVDGLVQTCVDYVNTFEWEQGVTPLTSRRSFYSVHVIYISILLWLTKYMKDRKSPEWLKPVAFVHNVYMSLLSGLMLAGLLYGAYLSDRFTSFEALTCTHPHPSRGLVPFSMYLFYLSKGLEFIDTFLLVLGKKKLIWLHKIHHLTTMGLVYHAMNSNLISDFVCGGTNCLVHVIMYAYFAKPNRFLRPLITSSQIAQFVLCLGFLVLPLVRRLFYPDGPQCDGSLLADLHGTFMYGLYLAMFINFFVQQYLADSRREKAAREQPRATPEAEKQRLLIDGRVYDVTEFMRRHPGGSIIKFGVGQDATSAFTEFHLRSKKAAAILKSLPSEADDGTFLKAQKPRKGVDRARLVKDFAAFHQRLQKEGWFAPSFFYVVWRVAEVTGIFAAGYYLVLETQHWLLGALALGIATGRSGWLMHEGGHYSMTGVIPVDRALQVILYGVGCGMSACYWRNQHNKHHATPQKMKHDTDLETMPLVAFNANVINRLPKSHPVRRFWLPLQAVLFTPLTCLIVALGWQAYQHPRHSLRVGHFGELACYIVRYVGWYYLFSLYGWSAASAVAVYVLTQAFGGAYIFTNFAISHTHLPTVPADDTSVTWVEFASDYTINCSNNIFVNWWMAYLNFQIEHHLFPSMPQYRFATLAPQVKKFFEEHNLRYDCRGYFQALGNTYSNLHVVANS